MLPAALTVVVVGHMNPAIHHPAWYLAGGSLKPEESEAVAVRGGVVIVPQFARFETARWRVECFPDRWTISTLVSAAPDEVIEVTCKTFERLCETPVSAFGLNYDRSGVLLAGAAPFEQLMSALKLESYVVNQLAFARFLHPMVTGAVTLRRQLNVVLGVTPEANGVLRLNVHHDIEVGGKFDLSSPLRAAYSDATGITGALAASILTQEQVQNADLSGRS